MFVCAFLFSFVFRVSNPLFVFEFVAERKEDEMLGGKKKYKCRFEVKVEKIEGLPDKVKGNPFRIEYARGKDHTGISRTLTMTSKNMAVNYSFKFECNLLYEEKKGVRKFSDKSLTFQVVAEKSKDVKKEANICKAEFDLVNVAVPGEFEPKQRIECHGKDKSDAKCVLIVSFKTEVLKIDGKKLVKKAASSSSSAAKASSDDPYDDLPDFGDDPAASSGGKGKTIQVDGQEYDLQTDMDLSEGGMDSDGDAKTENDYLSDSDEKADPFEQDAEPTEEEKKLAKKMDDEEGKKKAAAAEEAKKKADEEAAASAAAAKNDKKNADDKKAKEDEKKRKEDEDKKKKEEEKKKKEDEKKAKEEEEKRKKEEDKKRKEEEKKAKEEEERRKKQEKLDKASGVSSSAALVSSPSSSSVGSKDSTKDSKDAKDSSQKDKDSKSSSSSSATGSSSAIEAKLKQVQEERDNAVSEVKRLSGELEDEKARVQTLKKELKTSESALKDVESKLKREEAKNEDLESDLKRLQDRVSGGAAIAAGGVAAAVSSGKSSNSGGAVDSAGEIEWLEKQLKKVRTENESLKAESDDLANRLRIQEDLVDQHDAGYAAKCIADLETENAKLRKKLDDADLLKGDLVQELKHRQSERTMRVEKHQKEVEAGISSAEEITGYKRHSRQSSADSSASSSAVSPRTNGSSTTKKDEKKKRDERITSSAPAASTKKSSISMDDDSEPIAPSKGRRAAAPIAISVPSIAEESSSDAFASADHSAAISALETKVKQGENIELYLYNAKVEYDEDGCAMAANKMADYILIAQRALDRREQHSEAAHSLLVHILSALYGQTTRHSEDLDVLIGMFQWSLSLLQILQRETETLEDAPPASHMTWAADTENVGVVLTFDALIDAQEAMANSKFQVEKNFEKVAADATPGEAFLNILDKITCYIYALIFTCLQTVIDEQRLTDLFFGQTSQLSAALNGSNPNARSAGSSSSSSSGGNNVGNRRQTPPRPMGSFTAQLDVFLSSARRHRLSKTIEAQMLAQFFYWCSCTIVNALVRAPDYCSASVGMSLKVAVSHVEQWISQNSLRKLSGWVEEQFAATREVANVLTIDKHIFQSIDALEGIFTTLNIAQIHKLLTQFQPDDFAPDPVPRTTLDVLRNTINKTNTKVTFLDGTVFVNLAN